jgi:hypothetical protein
LLPGLPGLPGMEGELALGELLPGEEGLLRELLDEEELLEDELLEGIELPLVGICAEGGWLLLEVVLQPASSDKSTADSSHCGLRGFTACTCTSR